MGSARLLFGTVAAAAAFALMQLPASAPAAQAPGSAERGGSAPVTQLRAGSVTATSVALSWKNPSHSGFTGTMVRKAAGKKAPKTPTAGTLVTRLGAGKHTVTVGNLKRSTTYSFSVFALFKHGRHAKPETVTVTTGSRLLTGVKTVVTNSNEACALFTDKRVDCWGLNISDNLGSGVADDYVTAPVPVRSVGGGGRLTGVKSLTTDGSGFCGLMTGGTLDCWGDNSDGDLGQGDTSPHTYPVVVKGIGAKGQLSDVTQVVGGAFGYCAVLASGGVACWGNNFYGSLGSGSSAGTSSAAVRVVGTAGTGTLSGVESLTRVQNAVCALMSADHGLDCWGYSDPQQFGAPESHPENVPFRVPGVGGSGFLAGVRSVSMHGANMCAVLQPGGLDCWGANSYDVLGTGPDGTWSTSPVPVLGVGGTGTLEGVAEAVGDGRYMCARLTSGGVDCWGLDNQGELGGGGAPTGMSGVPQPVVGVGGSGSLSGATSLSTDFDSVCAVVSSKGVVCWGSNSQGELGNGTNTGPDVCGDSCNATPATSKGLGGTGALGAVSQLVSDCIDDTGGAGYYAVTTDGGVDFWGGGTNAEGLFGTYPFQDVAKYATPAAE